MAKILIIGAGITGGYMAARLSASGGDVSLLARGDKAERLESEGLKLRDAIIGIEKTVQIPIVRDPVPKEYDIAAVCVQEVHRPGLLPLLSELPGEPIIWYLGNTVSGYEQAADVLGRERVIGGFPSVGGGWDENVLVYADRKKPGNRPFDSPVAGAPYPEASDSLAAVVHEMESLGQKVETFDPIMDWHYCHAALVLPLAAAFYVHGDADTVASDSRLIKRAFRAVGWGLDALEKSGHAILPKDLGRMRRIPAFLGAWGTSRLIRSTFGKVALAGHAAAARDEMRSLAGGLLEVMGKNAVSEYREMLNSI